MVCSKCGQQVQDGNLFCTYCGTKVIQPVYNQAQQQSVQPQQYNQQPQPSVQPQQYNQQPQPSVQPQQSFQQQYNQQPQPSVQPQQYNQPQPQQYAQQQQYGQQQSFQPQQNVQPQPAANGKKSKAPKPPKAPGAKNKKPLIIGLIAGGVLLVALAVFLCIKLFGGGSGDNAYAYITDDELYLVKDINKAKPIEICKTKSDTAYYTSVQFGPKGEYLYFFTKVSSDKDDEYSYYGNLNRIKISKIKANGDNEKYIENIASNVDMYTQLIDDNTIAYNDSNDNLYIFDGRESTKIDKNVYSYYVTDDDKYIIYSKYEDSSDFVYDLYFVNKNKPDEKQKLASNISYLLDTSSIDNIMYETYDEEEYYYTLYTVDSKGNSQKLGEDGNTYYYSEDGINYDKKYISACNGDTISLYDFVDDNDDDEDKDYIREYLKGEDGEKKLYTLYEYKDGKLEKIDDDILNFDTNANCLIYNKADNVEKIDMDDIESSYDVEAAVYPENTTGNYILNYSNSKIYQFGGKADDKWKDLCESYYYYKLVAVGDDFYMVDSDEKELYSVKVKDNKLGDITKELDDFMYIDSKDGALYYTDDYYTSNDYGYINVYEYKNGKSELLAKDILRYDSMYYSDSALFGYTDVTDDKNNGYELTIFENGKKSAVVGEDITRFYRLDKNHLLYISDDDLYLYDGKDGVNIDDNVQYVYPKETMDYNNSFYYYE